MGPAGDLVEVQFTGWSGAGRVRHPVYLGIREDKAANEVVRHGRIRRRSGRSSSLAAAATR